MLCAAEMYYMTPRNAQVCGHSLSASTTTASLDFRNTFPFLWDAVYPFSIDLMASTAPAQRVPGGTEEALPFF